MARIVFFTPAWLGGADAALVPAHARSSNAGAWVFDRPSMLRQETNGCSTITRLSITRPIAMPVSGPMRLAQDVNLSGDQGLSSAAWFSGM